MTELKRLEGILCILHQNRIYQKTDPDFTDEKKKSLWARIRRYEAELEERRLALGITRN